MNQKLVVPYVILFCMFINGCADTTNNSNSYQPKQISEDTLQVEVKSGISMTLSGLRDSYNLTDTIMGIITLRNFADSTSFHVVFPFYPGYSFRVYNAQMKLSGGGPEGLGSPGINYHLTTGQDYKYEVFWSKNSVASVPGYIVMPAFSGEYYLKYYLEGNSYLFNKYLTKKIRINESGDQTPVAFVNSYDQFDIAILNLVMRNRFSSNVKYHFKDTSCAELSIVDFSNAIDTLYREKYYFPNNEFALSGKSDSLLFWYIFDKKKPELPNLNGKYKIVMKISFIEREYLQDCISYFYN